MSSVDVIVPCYRYGRFLRECVNSVVTQSLTDVRVLIIDDASPDNSGEVAADIASTDARVTFVQHRRNEGHIATYNEGIEWACADYMLLLSADDHLLPGALARATRLMDEHPEVGFTFGRGLEVEDDEVSLGDRYRADDRDQEGPAYRILAGLEFIQLSGARNIVSTPTAVVRTALQKRVGGYRVELPHTGDMEMWLRFAAHASVGMFTVYQAVYRRHSANMSLEYCSGGFLPDLKQRERALDYFYETCGSTLPNATRLRDELFWSLACCATSLASGAFNKGDLELSRELCDFAKSKSSRVTMSLPWIKLACKRQLGTKRWRAVAPLLGWLR